MTLKIGNPVILLRNLRGGPGGGLRNGTRMIVLKLGHKVLELEIANGIKQRKVCFDFKDNHCSIRHRVTIYIKKKTISYQAMLCNVNKQGTRSNI